MKIKVLGTGCAKCSTLEKTTKIAVDELGISAEVKKVEDIIEIMGYGVMRTPALVIDEKVVMSGKSLNLNEVKELLQKV
jgi:small redox-active disulfide protein 2